MSLKAITVNTAASDPAHIRAEDDAAIYQAIFGGDGVMNIGSKMAATVLSNNKVRVSDGVLCVGGHIARTKHADYQDMTIENGASGVKRNDIIYAKFQTSGDVDSFTLAVKKGVAGSAASDPAMTQGNLYQGATLREYPLWRVKIEGLSIVKVEQMFKIIPTVPELEARIAQLNSDLVAPLSSQPYGGYTMGESRYVRRSRFRQVNLSMSVQAYLTKNQADTVAFLPEGFRPDNYRMVGAYIIAENGARIMSEAYCYSNGDIRVICPVESGSYWVYIWGSYFI